MAELSASVRLKLDRAKEHADTMESVVFDWQKKATERFVPEVDHELSTIDTVCQRWVFYTDLELDSDLVSQALGDCINNFRSVLDHLIWELSVHHCGGGLPAEPHRIKFPSRTTGHGSGGLHAVDPAVRTEVEWLHDNVAGKYSGAPDPFWMLCELSNVDKHTSIHAIHHYAETPVITVDPHVPGTRIEPYEIACLKNETVLARIYMPRPRGGTGRDVQVHASTTNSVVISETAKTPRAHLGRTVDGIEDAVEQAAEGLRHLLP